MPILSALLLALVQPAPQPATLIVFRDYAEPVLFAPTLVVDGEVIGRLGQKRLIALALPPGSYRVELRWPVFASQPPAKANVTIRPGGRRFLEVKAAARFGMARAATALVPHDEASGVSAVACCRPAD